MSGDVRLSNWQFVVPAPTGRVLLLPVDDECLPDAVVPARTASSLASILREGPFGGVVVADLAAWAGVAGRRPDSLLAQLAASVAPGGWLYAGFPNQWFPARPFRRGSTSRRAVGSILTAAGFTTSRTYLALPDQRCPAYLVGADGRAELDYFLEQLFFPYVGGASRRTARVKQCVLDGARTSARRLPHRVRVALGPAMAVVAERD